MLKPVSILALDDDAAALADAVQRRVSKIHGLDDLVQWRRLSGGTGAPACPSVRQARAPVTPQDSIDDAIQSMRAQRQRPESPLRIRDDISNRELVLVVMSAAGPSHDTVLDTVARIRQTYESKRLASFFGIEILCLLPEVTSSDDYAAAYGLLTALSGADPKPFGEVWLVDATNGGRVQFGSLADALDTYADAVAGALTLEPELSGALPGLHPRGMPPAFSSFGYAELFFPRDLVLQRVESRFASELIRQRLLSSGGTGALACLQAKQFIVQSQLTTTAVQSVFKRFQPKTLVSERTRSAEELIAAVRNELQQFRDSVHLQNLDALAKQSDHAAGVATASLERTVDETLDQFDYPSAIRFLEALLDPLPDVRRDADASPRNLVTELTGATAALDTRLGFAPNMAASDAARKRVRELANLIQDQTLVADAMAPVNAADQIAGLEREQRSLLDGLPEIVFAEESANNAGRNSARDAEAARLAVETQTREQELRELFVQRPRAEHALREALEMRRAWIWKQIIWAAVIAGLIYAVRYERFWMTAIALSLFAIFAFVRYTTEIAPRVRAAREALERIRAQIDATDKAKNAAYNDELQFECDIAHRRATLNVLRRTRDAARETLTLLHTRLHELEQPNAEPAPIASSGLSISIIDDADVDAWYERTADDRKPAIRELPVSRSASRHLALDDLRARIAAHAATAFGEIRNLTLARAASLLAQETKLAQRMKRFAEVSAPLIDLRDDDLPANQAMQRDVTIWTEPEDARWVSQLQRRFPEAQLKGSPDLLRVHVVTRVLHFPAYVLGQIDFYRSHYKGIDDLVPTDLLLAGPVRAAYEQVLLGRALGVLEWRDGDSHLAMAEQLASSSAGAMRERLRETLAPRLEIARDVERDLRRLLETTSLTPLDRGILGALMKRYALV